MHAIAVGWIEREHLSTLGQPVKPVLVLPFPSKFGFIVTVRRDRYPFQRHGIRSSTLVIL